MEAINWIKDNLMLLLPILLVQVGLQVYAIVDLVKREHTKGPKWMWVIIIIAGEMLGPVAYLLFGRQE
jgi:hypothetical protein